MWNRKMNEPMPTASLQARHALNCFAAFFTLSPFALRNLSTHSSVQNFSCEASQKTRSPRDQEDEEPTQVREWPETRRSDDWRTSHLLHSELRLLPEDPQHLLHPLSTSRFRLPHRPLFRPWRPEEALSNSTTHQPRIRGGPRISPQPKTSEKPAEKGRVGKGKTEGERVPERAGRRLKTTADDPVIGPDPEGPLSLSLSHIGPFRPQ